MTKIKIITIKGKSPEDRARKIEEAQNLNENIVCKGSIYYESNSLLCADIFFVQGETEIKESLIKEETTEKIKPKKLISEKQFNLLKRLYKDLDMKFDVTMNWKSFQANKKIQELNKIKENYMNKK
jgi:hypothetical protein